MVEDRVKSCQPNAPFDALVGSLDLVPERLHFAFDVLGVGNGTVPDIRRAVAAAQSIE